MKDKSLVKQYAELVVQLTESMKETQETLLRLTALERDQQIKFDQVMDLVKRMEKGEKD